MRLDLEQIRKAEQFIKGELAVEEQTQFKAELEQNTELAELVQNLKLLEQAVVRSELRKQINNVQGGGSNWGQILTTIIVAVVIATSAFLYFSPKEKPALELQEKTTIEKLDQPQNSIEEVNQETVLENNIEASKDTFRTLTPIETPKEELVIEKEDITYQVGGHDVWAEPEYQNFEFNSEEGATIEGKDGMLVIVPFNAFVDSNGVELKGNVEFQLIEAFGITEMVLLKLKTVSNSSNLESGGMFYMDAKIAGQQAFINQGKPLYIEIPTQTVKPEMMAFKGKVNKEGEINWVDPKPLKKYLVKVDMNELDFLPPGFESTARGSLPFRNIITANDYIIDSLYYSLVYDKDPIGDSELERKKKKRKDRVLRSEAYFVSPDAMVPGEQVPEGDSVSTNDLLASFGNCGIDPSSVESIKTNEFYNTYIGTKEFEERIKVLHGINNGNDLLDIYVNNLNYEMYVSDSLVANSLSSENKKKFISFKNQRLTNIKDGDLYQKRLSIYYKKKRTELARANQKLAKELKRKNRKELNDLQKDIYKSEQKINRFSFPSPSAATSKTYSTPWYSMGWGNIDMYMKLLNKNSIESVIAVDNSQEGFEVTQWLKEINTYTNLVAKGGKAKVKFPRNNNSNNYETFVFGMAQNGDSYTWGLKRYNPYKTKELQLVTRTTDINGIKEELNDIDLTWGKLKKRLDWKKEQLEKEIKWQLEKQQRMEQWLEDRKEVIAKYNAAIARQEEEREFVRQLRSAAFPCENETKSEAVIEIVPISTDWAE